MKMTFATLALLLAGCANADRYLAAPPLSSAMPQGRLLFVSKDPAIDGPVYRLNLVDIGRAATRELAQSSEPYIGPRWSPDGKQYAYVGFSGGKASLYVQTLAGGLTRALVADAEHLGAPAWSPDGKQLAFSMMRDGNVDVYLVDLATGAQTQVTAEPGLDTDPAFAPDGKRIAYTSDRGGLPQVWEQPLRGKARRLVEDSSQHASYAPDGEALVFVLDGETGSSIELLELDSGARLSLSSGTRDQAPCFSPDGAFVAYTAHGETGHAIELVSRDGRVRQSLPTATEVRDPSWTRSP